MKKLLVFYAIFALTPGLIPASYASANNDSSTIPYIDGNTLFPHTGWTPVRYTFRINIPRNSNAVSQLDITVPDVITITKNNRVEVANINGRKINTQVSVNGKNVLLNFPEPVTPSTDLEIDIKDVQQPTVGNGPVYRLSVKFVGSNVEVPIGVARFRINL